MSVSESLKPRLKCKRGTVHERSTNARSGAHRPTPKGTRVDMFHLVPEARPQLWRRTNENPISWVDLRVGPSREEALDRFKGMGPGPFLRDEPSGTFRRDGPRTNRRHGPSGPSRRMGHRNISPRWTFGDISPRSTFGCGSPRGIFGCSSPRWTFGTISLRWTFGTNQRHSRGNRPCPAAG